MIEMAFMIGVLLITEITLMMIGHIMIDVNFLIGAHPLIDATAIMIDPVLIMIGPVISLVLAGEIMTLSIKIYINATLTPLDSGVFPHSLDLKIGVAAQLKN